MSLDNTHDQLLTAQPLLPRMKLIWSFAAITAAAILLTMVRWADEDLSMILAILSTLGWIVGLFASFCIMFLITYGLGVLENLLAPPEPEVLSPFAQDRLPEQIIAPVHVDDK